MSPFPPGRCDCVLSPFSHTCACASKMKKVGNIYVIAAVAVVGGALFGFDISSMSAQLSEEAYLCYFNQGDTPCKGPYAVVQGGITASMAAGSWLGALCSGIISDRVGRKRAIIFGCYLWWALPAQ